MKPLLSFIISLFCISISAKDIGHAESDTCFCMRQIVCDSLAFKGIAVGAVFDKFKEYGIPIRSISLGGTSAWIDPDGKSYLDRITITFLPKEETTKRILQERPFAMVVIYTYGTKMTIEEAMKRCNKNKKVLVAIQDLEDDSVDTVFIQKERSEYQSMFEDVKTVASACDDFVKQLRLFTEKQNIFNIEQKGIQKIILLKE